MDTHLKLYTTQVKQLTQTQTHPLHDLNAYINLPRNMKTTIFNNNELTNIIVTKPEITPEEFRENLKHIDTTITSQYLISIKNNKVIHTTPYDMCIHQNKHYHVICVQNWHSSEPTNHHCCKATYIQQTLKLTATIPTMLVSHTLTLIIFSTAVKYQQNTTQHNTISPWKKPLEEPEVIQEWESRLASLRD